MKKDLMYFNELVQFFGKSLGNYYSTILFEYSNNQLSLFSYYNLEKKHIEIIADFVRDNFKENGFINQSIVLEMNKLDKISMYPIKDENECVIGVFCLTMKCNPFIKIDALVHEFLNFDFNQEKNLEKEYPLTLEGITEYIKDFGITNEKITKDEKLEVICDLYDMGMFNIKGAVVHVAELLNTSSKSVYRHISKIKEMRD